MRRGQLVVWLGVVAAALAAGAEVVEIHPGNGVTTNVTERFTGDTVLSINKGTSKGGIVSLSPLSTYTGVTSNGCGTLVLRNVGDGGPLSDLGGEAGDLVLGPCTVRYTGPAGGVLARNVKSSMKAAGGTFFDIATDLTIAGDVDYSYGGFVKTGPGTLHLAGTGASTLNQAGARSDGTGGFQHIFTPKANGDDPTTGYRGFHVLEGTLVLGEGGGTYTIGNANNVGVGGWTTDDGQEKDATLEIVGGTLTFDGWMMQSSYNGKTSNTSDHAPTSTVRIVGGSTSFGNTYAMGRNKLGNSTFAQNTAPVLEVLGGALNCNGGLSVADDRGTRSTVLVRGGTLKTTNLFTARCSGHAEAGADVEVTGPGRITASAEIHNKSGDYLNLRILDGGYVSTTSITNGTGTLTVLVDGGTLASAIGKDKSGDWLKSSITRFAVGTRGAAFRAVNSGSTSRMYEPIVATNTADGAAAGVRFENAATSASTFRIGAAMGWEGPTTIGTYTSLRFISGGSLPADTDVTMENESRISAEVPVTFKSLSMRGSDWLIARPGAHVTVTGPFTVADRTSVTYALYRNGSDASPNVVGEVYPILTVRKQDEAALRSIAFTRYASKLADFGLEEEIVDSAGDTVTFQVRVTRIPPTVATLTTTTGSSVEWTNGSTDGLWLTGGNWTGETAVNASGTGANFPNIDDAAQTVTIGADGATAGGVAFTGTNGYTVAGGTLTLDNGANSVAVTSVGGGVNEISAPVAATKMVYVNSAATGAGKVKLSGAGLAGGLRTGSGTVEIDTLSFVQNPGDLVLGPGTLRYTGTGERIPGLLLNAGSEKAAILEVVNDLTLESSYIGTTAFMKTGPGTLRFAGTGHFNLGNTSKSHNSKGEKGIGTYGDSPTDTFMTAGIADGRLVIGTVGDASDAPEVALSSELDIGCCPGGGTWGELEMNNGSLSCATLNLGYYNGIRGRAPAGGTFPKFVMNGGYVRVTSVLEGGWDQTYTQETHVQYEIHGGEIDCATLRLQGYAGNAPTTTWTQDGGSFHCTGLTIGYNAPSSGKTWGPCTVTLDGGTFAVKGDVTAKNSTVNTIDVNEGAVFEAGSINGSGSTTTLRFNGGTWRGYLTATGNKTVQKLTHLYAKRTIDFDSSDDLSFDSSYRAFMLIDQKIERDPDAEGPVGFTVRGGGLVSFSSVNFGSNTLDGVIRAMDGSSLLPYASAFTNNTVVVDPGCRLRQYTAGKMGIKNLTLGAADATEPVLLDYHVASNYAKTNHNIIVSGTLEVLSPVAVCTHSVQTPILSTLQQTAGSYTALVYRAENTIDVTKFTTIPGPDAMQVNYQEVTIVGGTYDGWKALVATITSTSAGQTPVAGTDLIWSAVAAGGAWSEPLNWNGCAAPDAVGAEAPFLAATAAAVPVNVDAPATVGSLQLRGSAAANGYAFSGSPLALVSPTRTASIQALSGSHRFENVVSAKDRLTIDAKSGASVSLAELTSSEVVGTFVVNRSANTGGGEVTINRVTHPNTVATGCGRTILTDLEWANSAAYSAPLQIGRGTARYTGPSIEIPAIQVNNGGGYAGVLDVANAETTLTVRKLNAGDSTGFIKIGAGTLRIKGPSTTTNVLGNVAKNRSSQATTLVAANGDAPTSTFRCGNVSQGRVIQGTVGDPNDAPRVECSDFAVGVDSVEGEDCEYVVNNGLLVVLGSFYIDYYHGVNKKCSGKFTLNGGNVTSNWIRLMQSGGGTMYADPKVEVNGGRWDIGGSLVMGYQTMKKAGNTATWTMNGGTVNVASTAYLVYFNQTSTGAANTTADGYFHMNGGVFNCKLNVCMCQAAANKAYLNLNGGVFAPQYVYHVRGQSYLTFNGGVYAPHCTADNTDSLTGLTAAYVSTNGAVFSGANLAAGRSFTFSQKLLTDPKLNGAVDGGFRKIGKGTVILSGSNTFTGPVRVEAGVLRATQDAALSDELEILPVGTFDVNNDVNGRTVATVHASGNVVNGLLTVIGSVKKDIARDDILNVSGDLTIAAGTKLDFGAGAEEPHYGDQIALASVTGTCTFPPRMQVLNGDRVRSMKLSLVDGILWATPTSGGTQILVR